ncbi:hypothetical protein H0H92_013912 [Tricholoma furcatifolium]|nr:hypothetical protein H0H92_013912 [Tricholoma furcatifolium]
MSEILKLKLAFNPLLYYLKMVHTNPLKLPKLLSLQLLSWPTTGHSVTLSLCIQSRSQTPQLATYDNDQRPHPASPKPSTLDGAFHTRLVILTARLSMAQSTEEQRLNHNAACQRNLDKYRTSARERMRRLRARRKEELSSTTGANYTTVQQDEINSSYNVRTPGIGSTFNTQDLEYTVQPALVALEGDSSDVKGGLHSAHMELLMATLPPSSEPDYSDSEASDIHELPAVTSSSDDDRCWLSESNSDSSDDEREVVLLLTTFSDSDA